MKGKIFNAREVQSMLAGNKTQFREVIKPQPNYQVNVDVRCGNEIIIASVDHPKEVFCLRKPPYQVGQKIFCKESFGLAYSLSEIFYKANFNEESGERIFWKPAQHMKQEHSRLTLQITEIRVERLAEISRDDVWNEGWSLHPDQIMGLPPVFDDSGKERDHTHKDAFAFFWNATHEKPEEKWKANPWVFVYQFQLIK